MPKPAHRQGAYQTIARRVVAEANADPSTVCWRCHKPLHQHEPHRNGKPAFWTAGHVYDSDPLSPLLPEASTCNFKAGGHTTAARNRAIRTTRRW